MNKEEFIREIVLGWMKKDLLRMKSIIPSKEKVGNINFPLALCVISYMESLGSYLLGEDESEFKIKIDKYINTCFKNPNEYDVLVIRDLVRNKLVHEYFPFCAISRNGKHPAIHKGETYPVVLDAETLANDFIDSLDNFIVNLEGEKYEKIRAKQFQEINRVMEKYKDYIAKLSKQPNNDSEVTPSSGPSGPSGPIKQ